MYTLTHEIGLYCDIWSKENPEGQHTSLKETSESFSFNTFEEGETYIKNLIAELNPYSPPAFSFYYTIEDNDDDPDHHIIEFTFMKEVDVVVDGQKATEESHSVYFLKDK